MAVKYIPYQKEPLRGQAVLPFLRYHKQNTAKDFMLQGMPLFETELIEKVNAKGTSKNENLLIHGDCLNACAYLKDKEIKIDLVYIDPPFASGANYAKKIYIRKNPKLLEKLEEAEAKLKAESGEEVDNKDLQALEETMYGDIWQKEDYLNWMYERLLAIKEVMSDTGSIYVHLDWHIGHYVKVLLDEVFGEENFVNEIIWEKVKSVKAQSSGFGNVKDTIFFYSMSRNFLFNQQKVGHDEKYLIQMYKYYDETGRRYRLHDFTQNGQGEPKKFGNKGLLVPPSGKHWIWTQDRINEGLRKGIIIFSKNSTPQVKRFLDEVEGMSLSDLWNDINPIGSVSEERIDYSTQKPEALLERIIKASSNEGQIVADFFGGSGVTAKVAHDLDRKFITVDVGVNAIQTTRDRLVEAGASFDILKIKDGIDLFRNPAQTMAKLATIIPSLSTTHDYGDFWFGAITDNGHICPCWVPNLLDKSQAILNSALFSKILDEVAKLDGVSRVVICTVDKIDDSEIDKMIKEYDLCDIDGKPIQFVFKDLKELTDLLIYPDKVEYTVKQVAGKYEIIFNRFISDALMQKIAEFNGKKQIKDGQVKITISDEGLELIEYISMDCTNSKGVWKSDHEIKVDKRGYMIVDGQKTKNFWDGKIIVNKKPLRIKVRNIAGDETVIKT